MKDSGDKKWYGVFVPTGQEDTIKKRLEKNLGNDFDVVVVKRELKERKSGVWKQVTRTLFPGYILIHGIIDIDSYITIKKTHGIIKVLENHGEPISIPSSEISILSQLIKDDEVIGNSQAMIEGDKITIIDGPLKSLEGIVESVNKRKGRVKVKLSFFGEIRTVELGIHVVELS